MGKYRFNRYRDVEIDVSKLEYDNTERGFIDVLRAEEIKWSSRLRYSRERDTAVMWLNVPRSYTYMIPWILSCDFELHHANRYRVMLVKENMRGRAHIPSYGTHYVKVDCVVIEEGTGKTLLVTERLGGETTKKLVTGSTDAGEFIADAAIREVREETGVRCRFDRLLGCANRLMTRFDRDEIVMGCLLYAEQGQVPRPDGIEVSSAAWCDRSEILTCTSMGQKWLSIVEERTSDLSRKTIADPFRGARHRIDLYVPSLTPMQIDDGNSVFQQIFDSTQ